MTTEDKLNANLRAVADWLDDAMRPTRAVAHTPLEAELLDELQKVVDSLIVWQFQYDPDHTDEVTEQRIQSARAAYAKAVGRDV